MLPHWNAQLLSVDWDIVYNGLRVDLENLRKGLEELHILLKTLASQFVCHVLSAIDEGHSEKVETSYPSWVTVKSTELEKWNIKSGKGSFRNEIPRTSLYCCHKINIFYEGRKFNPTACTTHQSNAKTATIAPIFHALECSRKLNKCCVIYLVFVLAIWCHMWLSQDTLLCVIHTPHMVAWMRCVFPTAMVSTIHIALHWAMQLQQKQQHLAAATWPEGKKLSGSTCSCIACSVHSPSRTSGKVLGAQECSQGVLYNVKIRAYDMLAHIGLHDVNHVNVRSFLE